MRIYVWEVVVAIVAIPIALTILWWIFMLLAAPFMRRKKGGAPPEGNAPLT